MWEEGVTPKCTRGWSTQQFVVIYEGVFPSWYNIIWVRDNMGQVFDEEWGVVNLEGYGDFLGCDNHRA